MATSSLDAERSLASLARSRFSLARSLAAEPEPERRRRRGDEERDEEDEERRERPEDERSE